MVALGFGKIEFFNTKFGNKYQMWRLNIVGQIYYKKQNNKQ